MFLSSLSFSVLPLFSSKWCSTDKTRNAVRVKPPRVRIPNSPPEKNADLDTKVSVFSLPGKPYRTRLFIVPWMQTHPALLWQVGAGCVFLCYYWHIEILWLSSGCKISGSDWLPFNYVHPRRPPFYCWVHDKTVARIRHYVFINYEDDRCLIYRSRCFVLFYLYRISAIISTGSSPWQANPCPSPGAQ